jgi:hypothetical protein
MACDIVPAQAEVIATVGIGSHVYENSRHVRTGKAVRRILVFAIGQIPEEPIATGIALQG